MLQYEKNRNLSVFFLPFLFVCLFVCFRNPAISKTEAIKVQSPEMYVNKALIGALIASGFTRTSGDSDVQYFQPCPLGTFSNSSSRGTEGCTPCPPGECRKSSLQ